MLDLVSAKRRYKILRICLLLAVSIACFSVPVIAASTATYHQNGHITIVNGSTADLSVTPTLLDFGTVIWGTTVTQPITVTNTGTCIESVTATASQNLQPTIMATISSLQPGHSIIVNAAYDTTAFNAPGDYTFAIDWTATCL